MEAPVLTRGDLAHELGLLHGERRRTRHTAFFGQPDAELRQRRVVEAQVERVATQFRVVEVGSELELRRALGGAQEGEPLALLVTYGRDLAHDVSARVATGQVREIQRSRRLALRLGAKAVSPELGQVGPLVNAILAEERPLIESFSGLVVGAELAWRAFLKRAVPLDLAGPFGEDGVVLFCATHLGGPDFVRRMERFPGLREQLHAHLAATAGPVARIAWRAWEKDEGQRAAAMAFVLERCAEEVPKNGFVRAALGAALRELDPALGPAVEDRALLERWGKLTLRLAFRLAESAGDAEAVFALADRMLPRDREVEGVLAESDYLPRAFEAAKTRLAEALQAAAAVAGKATARAVVEAEQRLRRHKASLAKRSEELVERARMAARLACWLADRAGSGRDAELGSQPPSEVVPYLADEFARVGAFVDLARRVARGSAAELLGEAVQRVVEASDAVRDTDDARFAAALPAWLARKPDDRVVPIHSALGALAVPFLEAAAQRKLLVLLLDGMSWSAAAELLLDLEQHGYGPTVHQCAAPGRVVKPVLAALPTLTEVSRSAFFAGKAPKPGEVLSSSGDPDRFAHHARLGTVLGGAAPRLLLGERVAGNDGAATREALKLVQSDDRVVGVVVNAIDDQLDGGAQMSVRYRLETIKPLRDLLQAATLAGRAVLLVADHGHVPGARLAYRAPAAAADGLRWRSLAEGESAREGELALGAEQAWCPRGRGRVALLVSERECYQAGARGGVHGGAALAEVVAPAIFVGAGTLSETLRLQGAEDPGLEVRALPRPRFWDLELPRAAAEPARAEAPRAPESRPQGALPFSEPVVSVPRPAAPRAAPVEETAPLAVALGGSELFEAMLKRRPRVKKEAVLRAVSTLVLSDGRMERTAFAARIGELPTRVDGAVSRLSEVLNADGYPVLRLERAEGQVVLDLALLRQTFALEG